MGEAVTLPLYGDVVNRRLVASDGSGAFTMPKLTLGDTLICELHTVLPGTDGVTERNFTIRTIRASIGNLLAPPTAKTFTLKVEDPATPGTFYTSAEIAFDASAVTLAATLTTMFATLTWTVADASTPVDSQNNAVPGCWLFRVVGVPAPPALLLLDTNSLIPQSFVRIRTFQQGGQWWHELRLIQYPAAWNEDGFQQILPEAPTVTRLYAGAAATDIDPGRDELQDLFVPLAFRGTYFARWNLRRSPPLSDQDGPDAIATALNAMFTDNATRFAVTSPLLNHAYIEFIGDLAQSPQNLVTIDVGNTPPGILTFTISLARADMAALLRAAASVNLTFEVELEVVDDGLNPADPPVPGRIITLFQEPVTVVREEIFAELATVAAIDWQRPASPRTYIPFSPTQRIVGDHHFTLTVGDGAATEFDVPHNLNTGWLRVTVIDRTTGRQLADSEFEVIHNSVNDSTITFAAAPTANQFGVLVSAAGPIDTFINDLVVTEAQVTNLVADLASLAARLSTLEALSPSTPPALATDNTGPSLQITLPDRYEIMPGKFRRGFDFPTAVKAGAAALTNRPPALLPAVHLAALDDAPTSLGLPSDHVAADGSPLAFINRIDLGAATVVHLTDPHIVNITAHGRAAGDNVRFTTTGTLPAPLAVDTNYYVLATGLAANTIEVSTTPGGAAVTFTSDGTGTHHAKRSAAVLVDGGFGHASFTLAPWAFIASDGRLWYAVSRGSSTSTSYFPSDAERRFFTLAITPEMLRAGHVLDVGFQLAVATFNATTSASIQLVIEVGTAPSQTSPATTTTNLQDIVWNPTPLLTRRLVVNELMLPRNFGCTITRAQDGSFSANGSSDGFLVAGGQIPTDPTFVLGARLVDADTQNSVPTARGYIAYAFTGGTAEIQ